MRADEACKLSKENSAENKFFDMLMIDIKSLAECGFKELDLSDYYSSYYLLHGIHPGRWINITENVHNRLNELGYEYTREKVMFDYEEKVSVPKPGFFNKLFGITKEVKVKKQIEGNRAYIKWCCNEEDK